MSWSGSPLIANITWNAQLQPTGWSWAFTTPVNATRSYDTAGRTTATEITSYSYDAAGRITSLTQNLGQPADSDPNSTSVTFANTTFTVGYDATGRITSFGDGTTTTSFTYDANGNRQSSTTTAGATTTSRTYTVEATSNRLTGFTQDITGPGGNSSTAVSYTYNANGDITADGLRNFSFDAEGRLSSVATGSTQTSPTTRYAHSALGERLFKTEPLQIGEEPEPGQEQNFIEQLFTFFKKLWAPQTTTAEQLGWAYAYDEEGTLLSEIGMGGANSTGQTNYIWLQTPNGPMPVAAIVNGNTYAVHADHLNTPRRLTNQYGEAAWQWKFSAFGDETPTRAAKRFVDPDKSPGMGSGTVADVTYNLRYPGQYADQESGLHQNRHREYNPTIGRYPQPDPISLQGGWNRFVYASSDPLRFIDPLGLESWSLGLFKGVGAQFTFGRNPNGSGFMSMQFGWGIGGGFSYNPLGKQPGYSDCQGSRWGIGTGVYGQASFAAGPVGASVGPNLGRTFTGAGSDLYYGLSSSGNAKDQLRGFSAKISGGGQLTFFGGGTASSDACTCARQSNASAGPAVSGPSEERPWTQADFLYGRSQ